MTTAVTTAWAALGGDPAPAKSSIPDAKPELTAAVTIDGQKGRLYWIAGGKCDHLKKGDTVMVEWVKGKWKIAKSQTPELMQTLEQRAAASNPAVPSNTPGSPRMAGTVGDIAEMTAIVVHLMKALPEMEHQAIASLACTVFISRGKS